MENKNEKHMQSLNTIQRLQNMEKQLYENLKDNASRGENIKQQTSIIESINELSNTRIQLFEQLQSYYSIVEDDLDETKKDLMDEMIILKMTEEQMNQSKKTMHDIVDKKNHNLRMVEINNYYGKQYIDQVNLIQMIIFICLPLIVFGILYKMDILPVYITSVLVFMTVVVGVLYVGRKVVDMNSRSNMVYDEYDWKFDPNAQKPSVYQYDMNAIGYSTEKDGVDTHDMTSLESRLGLGCVGESCCSSNMVFDASSNKCVDKSNQQGKSQQGKSQQGKSQEREQKEKENFDMASLTIGSFHLPSFSRKDELQLKTQKLSPYDKTNENYASV